MYHGLSEVSLLYAKTECITRGRISRTTAELSCTPADACTGKKAPIDAAALAVKSMGKRSSLVNATVTSRAGGQRREATDPEYHNSCGSNAIVGYNENMNEDDRTGSHNVVIGDQHRYSNYGRLVAGSAITQLHTGSHACGGNRIASGTRASDSGGQNNEATGERSSITGGRGHIASGVHSTVSGGTDKEASGELAVMLGGQDNIASAVRSTLLGDANNAFLDNSGTLETVDGS